MMKPYLEQLLDEWRNPGQARAERLRGASAGILTCFIVAGMLGLAACTHQAHTAQADVDWYFLKEAANGRNMTLASWRMCLADPTCSPAERAELNDERIRSEDDYQRARAKVNGDHAQGWYANVKALPAFARDPSLGLDP
jgi:hypothetical protein